MIIGPAINLASGCLQALFAGGGVKGSSPTRAAVGNTQDTNQPSAFVQMLSNLQQPEQSNPPHSRK